MRAKLTLLRALVLGTVGGVLATGCQTYDFELVEPLAVSQTTETREIKARNAKPNLMMLVDTSGSMTLPVNENLQDPNTKSYLCRRNGAATGEICGKSEAFPCDTSGPSPGKCPTRWTSLQAAMASFLGSSGSIARIGLATYPDLSTKDPYNCGGSAGLTVSLPTTDSDDEATLVAKAAEVNSKLQAIQNFSSNPAVQRPVGGTPTNESLQYMGSLPELQTSSRKNFVLLLTDGLPNCNENFPNAYPSPSCDCTVGTAPDGVSYCAYDPYDKLGCLDKDGSVAAVKALKDKNIETIVIGFGAELATGTGTVVLNAMAQEGGFSRTCSVNADCGAGDTCDTVNGLCGRRFYQAANRDDLVAALRKISETIQTEEPCTVLFEAGQEPQATELVVVYLNGERVSSGPDTWSLKDGGIHFTGSTCQRIESSTPNNPVTIEVRAVRRQ